MVNLADVAPAGTVIDAGIVNSKEFVTASATTAPPAGAAEVSVTVGVVEVPYPITAGEMVSPASAAGGLTVSVAVLAAPLYVAVIVTAVTAVTALLVTVKFAVVAPAATVTDAGTVAAFTLLLVRVTTAPPAGAATPRVTV